METPDAREAGSLRELVVFALDGRPYGLPLAATERVVPMVAVSPLPGSPDVVLGAINLHGDAVPVLDVRRRLGLPAREYGPTDRLVIARTARRVVALPVDEVSGVTEVVGDAVLPPDAVLPGIDQLAGIAALPDGLLLIQDLETFFSLEEERALTEALRRKRR